MSLSEFLNPQTIPEGLRLIAVAIFVHGILTARSS